ncbi:VPA1267 family protein [Vibrio parahaemolyticus]|uniref:VPA1267 family protein n=1 Tax=Vibrio parahaemolyticus TaxID=670 RepID=UPI0004E20B08|nr:VPA1267 family protein [Vibrio parahaemolyticus]MDF4652447.1 VPA1267 family protein [Vibrio parahaemolyticus]MDG3034654.1 VPA1267 family protein [Vibrio parahaemolyticus]MDK9416491.1 VPA1267 family protein [Vibrio parahaemolyticus]MDK9417339.1 VPA1267 family protein [Vibrio parahaemolyticus]MDK9506335.1 VPA1267 family protein [Vibrio parahaemolyticus]
MASGQQKAQRNLEAFEVWKATQTDDEFKQIVFRGQLNRIEVAKGIGCGKSALNQNPALKKALKSLEDELRGKGVLPLLTDAAKKNEGKPQAYDNTASRKTIDSKRVSSLEAENIELKAKVEALEKRLERFGELSETLSEMGLMPR